MIVSNKTQIKKFISKGFVTASEKRLKKDNIFDFPHFIISNDKWWDGGYEPLCSIEEKRDFYEVANQALNIITEFAETSGETKCCVGPFHTSNNFMHWRNLNEFDSFNALKSLIKNNQYLIIDIFEDTDMLSLIVENNFRYLSKISIFFPNSNILIEPTHNSELLVFAPDYKKIKNLFINQLKQTNWNIIVE